MHIENGLKKSRRQTEDVGIEVSRSGGQDADLVIAESIAVLKAPEDLLEAWTSQPLRSLEYGEDSAPVVFAKVGFFWIVDYLFGCYCF